MAQESHQPHRLRKICTRENHMEEELPRCQVSAISRETECEDAGIMACQVSGLYNRKTFCSQREDK